MGLMVVRIDMVPSCLYELLVDMVVTVLCQFPVWFVFACCRLPSLCSSSFCVYTLCSYLGNFELNLSRPVGPMIVNGGTMKSGGGLGPGRGQYDIFCDPPTNHGHARVILFCTQ